MIKTAQIGVVGISQLRISCIVGILPFERQLEQIIYIDIKLKKDLSAYLLAENLQPAIDYVVLAELCCKLVQENKYFLLENLAENVLAETMIYFDAIWGWIRASKPSALENAQAAYIEIERVR